MYVYMSKLLFCCFVVCVRDVWYGRLFVMEDIQYGENNCGNMTTLIKNVPSPLGGI